MIRFPARPDWALRERSRRACLLFLLVLAGCAAVGPDYVEPKLALPDAWSNAPAPVQRENLARWWERLGDPQLTGLIAQALQANLDLRSAQARLEQARARRALAGAQRLPSVGASAGAGVSHGSDAAGTVQSYNAGFDASWEIDIFGARRRAVEAAEADLQSSEAAVAATRVSLAAEVARNYVELRTFQARLAIARNNLATQSETLQLTAWRAQAGLVSSLDVEQARANHEQTRAQVPVLQTSLAEARHRLAILLGVAPGELNQPLAEVAPLPAPPATIAAGIPADVLRQRPDVREAERTVAAETARIGQAEAARYPDFTLSGSIGLEAIGRDAPGGGATVTRSLFASLTAPIFDGGRLRQQVAIQRGVQRSARFAYESVVLTALEEVENALVGLASAADRRAALALALEAARNAALLAQHRYAGGLIDFQTVLDTQRSVLTIEDGLATSEGDGVLAVIQR
jgi:outer membrane protein, multidrug efflux system